MVDVIEWPPVTVLGHEHTIDRPGYIGRGLSQEPLVYSQHIPTRRVINMSISGIGDDDFSGGYIEALKHLLDGKIPLVRLTPLPQHWLGATAGIEALRGFRNIQLVDGETLVQLVDGETAVQIVGKLQIDATPGVDGVWNYIDCVGFDPSVLVAVPSELITINGTSARALRPAFSDATGAARIYLTNALPSGRITIGQQPIVCEIREFPMSGQQTSSADHVYQFQLTEVFEASFTGGFTYLNPWR